MSVAHVDPKHNVQSVRQSYYDKISKKDMAPLWEVLRNVVTKEPKSRCVPHVWKYDDVKNYILEAGEIITPEEAERRVLVLENPALRGQSRITNTLFAGIQLIMPGEVAEAHKHVSSAIRFVLDGEGAYTAVEGEKANMSRGDFILTPNWAPHDHGNPSKNPMLWLDVLDMPTINHFETSFMEHYDEKAQNTNRENGDSLERSGSGVLPDGSAVQAFTKRSPVINYTYARTKPIAERLMKSGDIDPRHGARVRYSNPVTGGHVMPTMGAYLAIFPKGFKGEDYRSTDGTIFVCVEGHGTTKVEDQTIAWGPNDVFVIPPWKRYAHNCPEETVLFSISDKPAQEALGIWREGN